MAAIDKESVLELITHHYLNSPDFNGLSVKSFETDAIKEWKSLSEVITELIEDDLVGMLSSKEVMNPHIIRTGFPPNGVQTESLGTADGYSTCLYPRAKHLESVVDRSLYVGRPYTLCLALGEPQLIFRSFDVSVLEYYRNDPRYY